MTIEFSSPIDNEATHVADALVRSGRTVTMASIWVHDGQLVVDGPAAQRLDPNTEAAILESYEITERYGY